MFLDQIGDIIRGHADIVDAFRINHHLRTKRAAPDAGSLQDLNLFVQALGNEFIL
jgi:hypothetical protein